MPLEKLPWAPFYIMATVGGTAAFFLDLLVGYLTFSFTDKPWTFLFVGTLFMGCIDEVIKYIAYISSVRREMKENLSRECICWLMSRAAGGYSVVLCILFSAATFLYGGVDIMVVIFPTILLNIVNNISCSVLTGVWLYVRKHHKHATHPTVPTRLEDCCMDSVVGPAICLRYLYYIIAFSIIITDTSTTQMMIYIGLNLFYSIFVSIIVVASFRLLKPNNIIPRQSPKREVYDRTGLEEGAIVFPDGSRA